MFVGTPKCQQPHKCVGVIAFSDKMLEVIYH